MPINTAVSWAIVLLQITKLRIVLDSIFSTSPSIQQTQSFRSIQHQSSILRFQKSWTSQSFPDHFFKTPVLSTFFICVHVMSQKTPTMNHLLLSRNGKEIKFKNKIKSDMTLVVSFTRANCKYTFFFRSIEYNLYFYR